MTLQEVTKQEQFEAYYKSNMLQTLDEKINNLKKEMKIKAIIIEGNETLEETLTGLEESVLLGLWKASQ